MTCSAYNPCQSASVVIPISISGAVLDLEHDKPVDKLIAMYNENLYQLPKSCSEEYPGGQHRIFDSSRYVPDNLKSAVKSMVGRFRSFSHSQLDTKATCDLEDVSSYTLDAY